MSTYFFRIKGAEARRRITFFVNSLFVLQPKKRRVLQMPSLTTLTPYYNEDVVSTTLVLPSCDVGGFLEVYIRPMFLMLFCSP